PPVRVARQPSPAGRACQPLKPVPHAETKHIRTPKRVCRYGPLPLRSGRTIPARNKCQSTSAAASATWPGRKPSAPSRTWWEWRVEGAGLTPPACRPTLLLGNGKGVALVFLGGTCGFLDDSCGRPELPRRDADEALEVPGELALVREAGKHGDLRQGQVAAPLQEVLRPLDTAGDDVLVRRQPGGRLELAG